ncbi:hypothetical protein N7D90_09700 [Pseudomonas fragi]|nr:hypothetical protein [Pseudomonas fragi]UXL40402.1 hypothetical protein N7D90_09700 [Pseudomonas fragi]
MPALAQSNEKHSSKIFKMVVESEALAEAIPKVAELIVKSQA